jgi:hypothetical protein
LLQLDMTIRYIFSMTLGQFATAVGAPKRWVQNAFQALGLPAEYTEELAQRLMFARVVKEACGMPLRRAFPYAEEAIGRWPEHRTWELTDNGGAVVVKIDLERFLSEWVVRLSLSRCWYAEKRRGRPWKTKLRGVALAKWYGEDVTLLQEHLKRTPGRRLEMLQGALDFVRRARVVG